MYDRILCEKWDDFLPMIEFSYNNSFIQLLECHGGIIWEEVRKESYGSGTCQYHEWED